MVLIRYLCFCISHSNTDKNKHLLIFVLELFTIQVEMANFKVYV